MVGVAAGCGSSRRLSGDQRAFQVAGNFGGSGDIADLTTHTVSVYLLDACPAAVRRLKAMHPDGYHYVVHVVNSDPVCRRTR